jgi:hypothetical protein
MTVYAIPLPDPTISREPGTYTTQNSVYASDANDEHFAQWQAMIADGRIGGHPPAPPEVVAQRMANDALFRSFAHCRRV